jgi:hypothetical protein
MMKIGDGSPLLRLESEIDELEARFRICGGPSTAVNGGFLRRRLHFFDD